MSFFGDYDIGSAAVNMIPKCDQEVTFAATFLSLEVLRVHSVKKVWRSISN